MDLILIELSKHEFIQIAYNPRVTHEKEKKNLVTVYILYLTHVEAMILANTKEEKKTVTELEPDSSPVNPSHVRGS